MVWAFVLPMVCCAVKSSLVVPLCQRLLSLAHWCQRTPWVLGASTLGGGVGTHGTGTSTLGVWLACLWCGSATYAGSMRALPAKHATCKCSKACICASLFVFHSPLVALMRSCNALMIMLAGVRVGWVLNLCLKNIVSDTLLLFVFLTNTRWQQ